MAEAQDLETTKQRLEREYGELLQELRSLIPGAQVLFGFLLAIRFTAEFGKLDDSERYVYYVTLLSTALALVLYLAPAVSHRVRFREGDKEFLLHKANREALAGSVATALPLKSPSALRQAEPTSYLGSIVRIRERQSCAARSGRFRK